MSLISHRRAQPDGRENLFINLVRSPSFLHTYLDGVNAFVRSCQLCIIKFGTSHRTCIRVMSQYFSFYSDLSTIFPLLEGSILVSPASRYFDLHSCCIVSKIRMGSHMLDFWPSRTKYFFHKYLLALVPTGTQPISSSANTRVDSWV
jgi:hypothetical protein